MSRAKRFRGLGGDEAPAARALDSDRYKSLVCDANCRDYHCKVIAYTDANGRVLGMECDVTVESGAYSPWPWPAGLEGGLALGNMQGCYDIRAFRGPPSTS